MKPTSPSTSLRLTGIAAVIALLSPLAQAQQDTDKGWYVGFGLGEAHADLDNSNITNRLQRAGFVPGSVNGDDKDFAGKVYAGYSFNPYMAVEGSYYNFGHFGFNTTIAPNYTFDGRARVEGMALDLVAKLPISDRFSVIGRAGIHDARTHEHARFGPGWGAFTNLGSDNDTDAKFGLGVQYAFNDNLSLRAEAERYNIKDSEFLGDHVDMYTVGLVYRFGARSTPAPAPAAAPAPTPAPAPAPAPAPPPQPQRVTLEADALFDFDSAEMRTAGRQSLDVLMEDLRGYQYDILIVTGHTDRIGSDQYNQGLSQRRAETVRSYLISNGIPANDIRASGVGESQPVTRPDQCTGGNNDALKACLQPDRRVEVEVAATRNP